jgi:transcriptional regulator with XRE-family HTH domain
LPFCRTELKAPRPPSPHYPKQINTLGHHIRKRRFDLGLRQKQVAEILGVTESTISNWEGQRNTHALICMPAIIRFLGYNPLHAAEAVASKLTRYRISHGLTQKESAKDLGVDPSTLARWERGDRTPSGLCRKLVEKLLTDSPQDH